jgi:hypothetical protein
METNRAQAAPSRYQKISWAIAGLLSFIWIGVEDRTNRPVIIIAVTLAIAIGLTLYNRMVQDERSGERSLLWVTIGVGFISGLLVPIAAVILMLVKTSLHSHVVPDFSVDDVIAVLLRTPVWVISGLMIGAAIGMLGNARASNRT